jgi:hypothetical protein
MSSFRLFERRVDPLDPDQGDLKVILPDQAQKADNIWIAAGLQVVNLENHPVVWTAVVSQGELLTFSDADIRPVVLAFPASAGAEAAAFRFVHEKSLPVIDPAGRVCI